MKVKATLLPTGGYHFVLVHEVVPSDFTIMAQDVRVPETYNKWDDQVTRNIEFRLDLISMENIIDTGKAGMLLSVMGFHSYPRGKEEEFVLRYRTETIATNIRLKNVRKTETKLARVNEALEDIAQKSDPDGDYFRGWLVSVTEDINRRLRHKFECENKIDTDRFKNFLYEQSDWAKSTDEKAGVKEALAQVDVWYEEIDRLEEKIRNHDALIREARAKVFVDEWEAEDWIWNNTSDNGAEVVLPEVHRRMVREMAENGDLFKGVGHFLGSRRRR